MKTFGKVNVLTDNDALTTLKGTTLTVRSGAEVRTFLILGIFKVRRKSLIFSQLKNLESQHNKTNKMTCAHSEESDQPGHSPSQSLLCTQWVAKDPVFLHADSED